MDGFLRSFEGWVHAREVPEHLWYTVLQGALKKEAQQFEYNLSYVHGPSYKQLCQALLENYRETVKMFYFELSELTQCGVWKTVGQSHRCKPRDIKKQ